MKALNLFAKMPSLRWCVKVKAELEATGPLEVLAGGGGEEGKL